MCQDHKHNMDKKKKKTLNIQDKKITELIKLNHYLFILKEGRRDKGGGDSFLPGHMVRLTD